MMKRIIAAIVAAALLLPEIGQATTINSPADFLPKDVTSSIEFQYTKKRD